MPNEERPIVVALIDSSGVGTVRGDAIAIAIAAAEDPSKRWLILLMALLLTFTIPQ